MRAVVGGFRDQAIGWARRGSESGVRDEASVGRNGGMERVKEKRAGGIWDHAGEEKAGGLGRGEEGGGFDQALDSVL